MHRISFAAFAIAVFTMLSSASAQSLPAANPISAIIPDTNYSLTLERVIRIPDSGSGNTRFARIEQTSPVNDGSGRIFVADNRGDMYWFNPGDTNPTHFFDFTSIPNFKANTGTSGLRAFAFHPNAFTPGTPGYQKLYAAYSLEAANNQEDHRSVISEFTLGAGGVPIASSRRELFTQSQPLSGHNVGKINFNPNLSPTDSDYGNLYITFGDGGNHVAPAQPLLNQRAQDTSNFLGSVLRINPLQSGSSSYTIPTDNPFVGQSGFRPEIWAYGLRNPHHFGFDLGGNGDMFIADIGQSNIEEVNIGVAGANYGWSVREGTFDVTGKAAGNPISADVLPANHVNDPYTYPALQYDHDFENDGQDSIAIAGGYVYRGSLVPELQGKYLFGDFANNEEGPIFVVDVDELELRDDFTNLSSLDDGFLTPIQKLRLTDDNGQDVSFLDLVKVDNTASNLRRTDMRFGYDLDGEVYVTSKRDGWIRRFVSTLKPGDYNRDGVIDAADYTVWRDTRGQSADLRADGNGDSVIDNSDWIVWASNFGDANPTAFVPEPASTPLLWGLLMLWLAHRRAS